MRIVYLVQLDARSDFVTPTSKSSEFEHSCCLDFLILKKLRWALVQRELVELAPVVNSIF
jgi:arginase family enzyme